MSSLQVAVNGAAGKMGSESVRAIEANSELQLVGTFGQQDSLSDAIEKSAANIVVDFTTVEFAYENTKTIIEAGAHPVIGTSGFTTEQINELTDLCAQKNLGGIIAPNFSIGAILMMRLAAQCAENFPHVEIIELHHDQKVDSPSGTAMKTAEMISHRRTVPEAKVVEKELLPGARGAQSDDIRIHSVRLPGMVAHQEVLFGGHDETLSIRHDSLNRESFMPGVLLACKRVKSLNGLVYGLDQLLF